MMDGPPYLRAAIAVAQELRFSEQAPASERAKPAGAPMNNTLRKSINVNRRNLQSPCNNPPSLVSPQHGPRRGQPARRLKQEPGENGREPSQSHESPGDWRRETQGRPGQALEPFAKTLNPNYTE